MREGKGVRSATFDSWAAVEIDHPGDLVFGWIVVCRCDDGRLIFLDAASEDLERVGGRGGFGVVLGDEEVVFGHFELAFRWNN